MGYIIVLDPCGHYAIVSLLVRLFLEGISSTPKAICTELKWSTYN